MPVEGALGERVASSRSDQPAVPVDFVQAFDALSPFGSAYVSVGAPATSDPPLTATIISPPTAGSQVIPQAPVPELNELPGPQIVPFRSTLPLT